MKDLTIAYITSRKDPKIEWFLDSLEKQVGQERVNLIVVQGPTENKAEHFKDSGHGCFADVIFSSPKPTVWQGPSRLTKEDWWAKSNALNTAICLCRTEWIAFVDDRSVLMPGWLDRVKDAMDGDYAVCGSYEKHLNLKVENGVIVDEGTVDSKDHRAQLNHPQPTRDWYGGHGALPLEWCLAVNGFSEDLCDGLGSEDSMFGVTLHNNRMPIRYDARMKIIEDRTQGEIDGALKRSDYGVSPNDKSHAIVNKFWGAKTSMNSYDIRELRDSVLSGNPFPPPTASDRDWFTGELLSEKT